VIGANHKTWGSFLSGPPPVDRPEDPQSSSTGEPPILAEFKILNSRLCSNYIEGLRDIDRNWSGREQARVVVP
jgi:hypothetical protein